MTGNARRQGGGVGDVVHNGLTDAAAVVFPARRRIGAESSLVR